MESIPDHYKSCIKKVLIKHSDILAEVDHLAAQLIRDNMNKEIKIICVLKGAFRFSNDLLNALYRHNLNQKPITLEFIRVSSYLNDQSTGNVLIDGLDRINCTGKNVVICEDIVDTGKTIKKLINRVQEKMPHKLSVASLFFKRNQTEYTPDYFGFEIPNEFIIGYGLDYNEMFRDMDHVCVINEYGINKYEKF